MTNLVLILAGLAGVVGGVALATRLRRWQPTIHPDLGEYDPGPDAIDWMEAGALLLVGVLMLLFALLV